MNTCNAALLAFALAAPAAAGAASVPGKAEIASMIAMHRAQVGSLQATTTLATTSNQSGLGLPLSSTETLAFDGVSFRADSALEYHERSVRRVVAFDGATGVEIVADGGAVIFDSEASMQLHPLRRSELLWMMRWLDATPELPAHPKDLLSVLQSELSVVRPRHELVDGVACVVLDVYSSDLATIAETLWLDPNAGYLPRRQRSYAGGTLSLERQVSSFIEAAPGVSVPAAGTKLVHGVEGTIAAGDVVQSLTTHAASLEVPSLAFGSALDLVDPALPVTQPQR